MESDLMTRLCFWNSFHFFNFILFLSFAPLQSQFRPNTFESEFNILQLASSGFPIIKLLQ